MFRASIEAVPSLDRDAWLDVALGLGPPPVDGPELPPGGVPYLPCAIDSLLRFVDVAAIAPTDVVVDIGSGAGRAAVTLQLLTDAAVVGVEVQRDLVAGARALAARLDLARVTFVEADAALPPSPRRLRNRLLSLLPVRRRKPRPGFSPGLSPSHAPAPHALPASTSRYPRSPGSNWSRRPIAISPSSARGALPYPRIVNGQRSASGGREAVSNRHRRDLRRQSRPPVRHQRAGVSLRGG